MHINLIYVFTLLAVSIARPLIYPYVPLSLVMRPEPGAGFKREMLPKQDVAFKRNSLPNPGAGFK